MKKLLLSFLFSITYLFSNAQCSGTLALNSLSGTISDGSGDYLNDQDCSWLIQPSGGGTITINFTSFNTESGYDYVRVYDGSSSTASIIGDFSGSSLPASISSTGNRLFITFTSDGSVTESGFELNYSSCTLPNVPSLSASGSLELCTASSPPVLTSDISPVVWNTGQTTASISAANAGIYFVTASNGTCSVNSDTIVVVDGSPNSSISTDYNDVCAGASIEVSGVGSVDVYDDFSSVNTSMWSSNTGTYTSSCQSSGRLFFESNATYRELVSNPVDLSGGGEISFNLEVSECEGIAYDEEVALEISRDGGASWSNLETYDYDANVVPKDELYVLSASPSNSNAMIRWRQESHDGSGLDTWSLDNVSITSNGNNSGVAYSWSPASAFSNSSSQNTFLTVNSNTTISLSVTDLSTGCSSSSTKTIGVNPNYLGLSLSPMSKTVCAGESVDFVGSLTNNSHDVQYSWISNGEVVNVDAITTSGDLNSTQVVSLVAQDVTTGCSVTATSSISVSQYVNKPLLISTGSLCLDNQVTIISNTSATWSTGAVGSSITVTAPGQYYAYTGSNSCKSYSDTIAVVDDSPSANIEIGNPAICAGGVVELSATMNDLEVMDDFSSSNTSLWSTNTGTYTSSCQPAGRLFFEGNSTYRELVSNLLDLSSGGEISFNLEVSECEGIAYDEEVALEISRDGGVSWSNLETYDYNANVVPKDELYVLSASPSNSNVMIRWRQESHDGSGLDTWSLDNVSISNNALQSNNSYSYAWSPSSLVENASLDITKSVPINSSSFISLTLTDNTTGCETTVTEIIDISNGSVSSNPSIVSSSDVVCTGGNVELQVMSSSSGSNSFADDFSNSSSSNWSVNTGSFYPDCSSSPSGALYFYSYGDRELVSKNLDLSLGADVSFDVQLGDCETVDFGEDVVLQISDNGGQTWTILHTVGYSSPARATYNVNIPASSANNSAKLRWFQLDNSGSGNDTWFIDNVEIDIVSAPNSTAPYTYNWFPQSAYKTSSNSNKAITKSITGSTSYSVTVTETSTNCTANLSKTIGIADLPLLVDITTSSETVCEGGSVQLFANVDNDVADYSKYGYEWTPSLNLNDDTLHDPKLTDITSQTNFVVTVTDKFSNCSGAAVKMIKPNGYVVKPTVSQTGDFLICNEYTTDLAWFLDGVLIAGQTSQLLNLSTTNKAKGCYTVTYNGDTCEATSACLNYGIDGVGGLNSEGNLNAVIYPNPVNDKLSVNLGLGYLVDDASFNLYSSGGLDVTGQVEMSSGFGDSEINLDVVNLAPGLYILKIRLDSMESFETFIKL
jgi:hypothetical protein